MYDSPKAAHFIAFQNGKSMPPNDPDGLAARWGVARDVQDRLRIDDMLRLTLEQDNNISLLVDQRNAAVPAPPIQVYRIV